MPLLDIVPPDADGLGRNKIAAAGLEAAKKSKPAAFFEPSLARLVTVGNFEDDLKKLAEVDWIIEAVVENLEIKRGLLKKVEADPQAGNHRHHQHQRSAGGQDCRRFSDDFRRSWFGTHFFNPPRYMRLLEIIPTPETDRAAIDAVAHFCDLQLGKGVVFAKDTPNFIANRIGTFSVLNVMRLMQEMDLTIEEVDALTGACVGWPKSATFRTIDLVGLDILGTWWATCIGDVQDERAICSCPISYRQMLERKWLGDKTKGGFYKKIKGTRKEEERLALDWKTLEYRPVRKPNSLRWIWRRTSKIPGARLRMLLGSTAIRRRGQSRRVSMVGCCPICGPTPPNRMPEIADTVVEIDRAMRLGFNWELGPFELWDAAGVEATVARMKKEGQPVAANVEQAARRGQEILVPGRSQSCIGPGYFDLRTAKYEPVKVPTGVWSVAVAKKSNGVVRKNAGASLVDLGDGVGCIEFHSKMNSLGGDIVSLVTQTLKPGGAGRDFDAFVITNDADQFFRRRQPDAAADVRAGRRVGRRRPGHPRISGHDAGHQVLPAPVVVAPFGMALGGGAEISLHARARGNRTPSFTWDWWKSASACCPAAAAARRCCCARWTAPAASSGRDAANPWK